jgi:hypothetical protein
LELPEAFQNLGASHKLPRSFPKIPGSFTKASCWEKLPEASGSSHDMRDDVVYWYLIQ